MVTSFTWYVQKKICCNQCNQNCERCTDQNKSNQVEDIMEKCFHVCSVRLHLKIVNNRDL